jgi:hypothetical protein
MSTQAQTAAKAGEVSAEYQAHVDSCIARHEPATVEEDVLVRTMADALWSAQVDSNCYEKSLEIYFRAYGELRDARREEDREIRELHRTQAADFSAYVNARLLKNR